MKITRNILRRLIETTIKPSIPNVPSEDLLGKIDDFASSSDLEVDADSFAHSFGYPEDRSYVDDLRTYEAANRVTLDTVAVKNGQSPNETITIPIPYELTDELIRRYQKIVELESQGISIFDQGSAAFDFREIGMDIYQHIHDHLADKHGYNSYDIYSYGPKPADGYLADKYEKAMEKVGEYL